MGWRSGFILLVLTRCAWSLKLNTTGLNAVGLRNGRNVYIDLGANCGNSYPPTRAMFGHTGIGFIGPRGSCEPIVQEERWWDVAHLFEANPDFAEQLSLVAKSAPAGLVHVHNVAVGTKNGLTTFFACGDACSSFSSVRDDRDFFQGESDDLRGKQKNTDVAREISVPQVDLAEFLCTETTSDDFVVIKMDVEGAEYSLIPHLAESQCAAGRIDRIYLELHDETKLIRLTSGETLSLLRAKDTLLNRFGVGFFDWS